MRVTAVFFTAIRANLHAATDVEIIIIGNFEGLEVCVKSQVRSRVRTLLHLVEAGDQVGSDDASVTVSQWDAFTHRARI